MNILMKTSLLASSLLQLAAADITSPRGEQTLMSSSQSLPLDIFSPRTDPTSGRSLNSEASGSEEKPHNFFSELEEMEHELIEQV